MRRFVIVLFGLAVIAGGCESADPAQECTVCRFSEPWFETCDQLGRFSESAGGRSQCELETGARLTCKSPIECCNSVGLHYNGSTCVDSLRNPPVDPPTIPDIGPEELDAGVDASPNIDATVDADVGPVEDVSVDMMQSNDRETDDDCPENYACEFDPQAERRTCVSPCGGPCPPGLECIPTPGRDDVFRCGRPNQCPLPRVVQSNFSARPLDVVLLDGEPSVDSDGADGRPIRYEWVLISRPDGSVAPLVEEFNDPFRPADGGSEDDPTTPRVQFFVDLAGTYVIELRVMDDQGLSTPSEDCPGPAARVRISALPDEDIHLQLVWDTPSDSNQTDEFGSDMDLHLLHPNGDSWFRTPWDCHYGATNPDWGIQGQDSDDPSLDIDDINGAGPENINLDNPQDTDVLGRPYRVAVHYYRSNAERSNLEYGPSTATLRVYLGGDLVEEYIRQLRATNDLWEVVNINWPSGVLDAVDLVLNMEPGQ